MNTSDLERDAEPVDDRSTNEGGSRPYGEPLAPNRIRDSELFRNDPQYPRNAAHDPLEPMDLVHIVFVRAKEDFEKFQKFLEWFEEIKCTTENGYTLRIETHDSEEFPPAHDDNIHDICERAMFILPFLSKHYCSDKKLRFFTSEGIGKTRLDPVLATGKCSRVIQEQKKYCIRPIRTADPKFGEYQIPTGLTTIRGIDYYSKAQSAGYVKNQVTGIIKEALRKFRERNGAMIGALTGADDFLENFNRRFESMNGPPPTTDTYNAMINNFCNPVNGHPNSEGVQNKVAVQQMEEIIDGENLPGMDGNVTVERTDNGGNLTTGTTEGSGVMETHQNTNSNADFVQRNGEHSTDTQRNTTYEGKTLTQPSGGTTAEDREYDGTENDSTLELDHGSLSRGVTNTGKYEGNQDHLEMKAASPTPVRSNSASEVVKIPDDLVMVNNASYSGPAVPNVAKAATAEGHTAERSRMGNPQKRGKKPNETVIVIHNCNVVQIGENSAIRAAKIRGNRKSDLDENPRRESSWNDTSSSDLSNLKEEEIQITRPEIPNTRPKSSEIDSEDPIQDNIPSDYSGPNPRATPVRPIPVTGFRNPDDYSSSLDSEAGDSNHDMDSYLDNKLNEDSLESLTPYRGSTGHQDTEEQRCISRSHEPVFRLCKNTLKRHSSVDSGYHSHFSHVYRNSQIPTAADVNTDDDID